jgi:hypothetical protein
MSESKYHPEVVEITWRAARGANTHRDAMLEARAIEANLNEITTIEGVVISAGLRRLVEQNRKGAEQTFKFMLDSVNEEIMLDPDGPFVFHADIDETTE